MLDKKEMYIPDVYLFKNDWYIEIQICFLQNITALYVAYEMFSGFVLLQFI